MFPVVLGTSTLPIEGSLGSYNKKVVMGDGDNKHMIEGDNKWLDDNHNNTKHSTSYYCKSRLLFADTTSAAAAMFLSFNGHDAETCQFRRILGRDVCVAFPATGI
jgi:hypothetical protein